MSHMTLTILTVLFFLLGFMMTSNADTSMRCGNKLIYTGDSKAEILIKCGEPMLKETMSIASHNKKKIDAVRLENKKQLSATGRISENTELTELVEQWTYSPGEGRFLQLLKFRGGSLESITDGDRI